MKAVVTILKMLAPALVCIFFAACTSTRGDGAQSESATPANTQDEAKLRRILDFQAALKQAEAELEKLDPESREAKINELRKGLSAPVTSPRAVQSDHLAGRDEQIMVASAELDRLSHEEREERIRSFERELPQPNARAAHTASSLAEIRKEDDAVSRYLKEAETLQASWPKNPTSDDYARLEKLKEKYLASEPAISE